MKFGEYFKKLRNSNNVTQREIADVIGKKAMLVSNVENNKNGPFTYEDLEKIAKFLSLTEEEKRQLFTEAAKASGKLSPHIWEYTVQCENTFVLLEMISKKKLDNEQLIDVIEYVKKIS